MNAWLLLPIAYSTTTMDAAQDHTAATKQRSISQHDSAAGTQDEGDEIQVSHVRGKDESSALPSNTEDTINAPGIDEPQVSNFRGDNQSRPKLDSQKVSSSVSKQSAKVELLDDCISFACCGKKQKSIDWESSIRCDDRDVSINTCLKIGIC